MGTAISCTTIMRTLFVLALAALAQGFTAPPHQVPGTRRGVLRSTRLSGVEMSAQSSFVQQFLMQRAVCKQLVLLNEVGQSESAKWLENLECTQSLLEGQQSSWEEYTQSLLNTQFFKYGVEVAQGWKSGSAGNPYIKPKVSTYVVDINPQGIAENLLNIREQLADEWREDLLRISGFNNAIFEAHQRELLGLTNETAVAAGGAGSSPIRRQNLELLRTVSLKTALQSVHQLLSEDESHATQKWLEEFCSTHLDESKAAPKDGADAFLSAMLASPLAIRSEPGSAPSVVDPLAVFDALVAAQEQLVQNWHDDLEDVREDHLDLKREILEDNLQLRMSDLDLQRSVLESNLRLELKQPKVDDTKKGQSKQQQRRKRRDDHRQPPKGV